jgi:ubiquinone/menaquinone biosynthesis C-methylase UbiE
MKESSVNDPFDEIIQKCVPNDHSRQVNSEYYIDYVFNKNNNIKMIMDLGCGNGDSFEYFTPYNSKITWIGLDIASSPEVNIRIRNDLLFVAYDGVNIPFDDNSFDVIFSNQVFEHVRYPELLLKETKRVLKPEGYFIGSVSSMEPYHSYSLWNYTPYGFSLLIEEAGMELIELRPSIDAITIIVRKGMGYPDFFSRWWNKESPLNRVISIFGKVWGKDQRFINKTKLSFCGHFCFLVKKPSEEK